MMKRARKVHAKLQFVVTIYIAKYLDEIIDIDIPGYAYSKFPKYT